MGELRVGGGGAGGEARAEENIVSLVVRVADVRIAVEAGDEKSNDSCSRISAAKSKTMLSIDGNISVTAGPKTRLLTAIPSKVETVNQLSQLV